MRWSLKIGRIAGIDLRMHPTFLLLLVWVAFVEYAAQRTAHAALVGVLFTIAVFVTVVLHELGHSLVARRFGVQTRQITLLPIGGVAQLERIPEEPRRELWIAVAGPVVSLSIAAILYVALRVGDIVLPDMPSFGYGPFVARLMWVNVALAVFNLLPAFPMDGGRIFRAALATRMPYARATRIAARMGQGVAVLLGIAGLLSNPFLMIIAVFVWMGASQEGAEVELRSGLAGYPASAAMVTEYRTLGPDDALGRAAELILAGSQEDFPVVEEGRVTGVLTRQRLLRALAENGPAVPVREAMERDVLIADPSELLSGVLAKLGDRECRTVPLVRNGELMGLLTPENVVDFISLQAAKAARAAAPQQHRHAM